ncbi:MAG: carbohydrate ABC transporter permease [Chloroflexi bacterium]|nr:carbohydrate ABC transporter permease [Chloroflexota bacterium]
MATLAQKSTTAQQNFARTIVVDFMWRRIVHRWLPAMLIYALLVGGALFFIFPLAWMGGTSLKTVEEIQESQRDLVPDDPQWQNYEKIFHEASFYRSYFNSVFIVSLVLFGTVTSVSLVAYSFSRLQWKGRNVVFALMMSTLMLPYQATLVPQYVLFYELDWIRTFNPITIPGFFAGGAALIFLLRQFMMTIPKELDEAAMIDGASPIQIWWFVVMPLSRPAIATISVFLFVGTWNNLLQPLIYLQKPQLYTLPIYVAQKLNFQESPLPWQDIMAASVLSIIPIIVVFILTQRYFTEGITLTGMKG